MSRYSSLNPNADYSRGVPSLCPDDVSNHSARSGHSFLALRSTSSDWVSAKEKRTMAKFINVVGTIVILWSVVTLRVIIYHSKQLKDCLLVVVRVPLKVEGASAQLHPHSTKSTPVQVKRLTNICWHLNAPPSTQDFSGKVGLKLALGLVISCCSHQTAC